MYTKLLVLNIIMDISQLLFLILINLSKECINYLLFYYRNCHISHNSRNKGRGVSYYSITVECREIDHEFLCYKAYAIVDILI